MNLQKTFINSFPPLYRLRTENGSVLESALVDNGSCIRKLGSFHLIRIVVPTTGQCWISILELPHLAQTKEFMMATTKELAMAQPMAKSWMLTVELILDLQLAQTILSSSTRDK